MAVSTRNIVCAQYSYNWKDGTSSCGKMDMEDSGISLLKKTMLPESMCSLNYIGKDKILNLETLSTTDIKDVVDNIMKSGITYKLTEFDVETKTTGAGEEIKFTKKQLRAGAE
jgi:hypothetical protein